MTKVFFITFGIVALIYAFLAAFTRVLYALQNTEDLSLAEMQIRDGAADFTLRLVIFVKSIFASVFSPPIYITSGLVTFIYWLIN